MVISQEAGTRKSTLSDVQDELQCSKSVAKCELHWIVKVSCSCTGPTICYLKCVANRCKWLLTEGGWCTFMAFSLQNISTFHVVIVALLMYTCIDSAMHFLSHAYFIYTIIANAVWLFVSPVVLRFFSTCVHSKQKYVPFAKYLLRKGGEPFSREYGSLWIVYIA